jgi:hypothetical protein
LSRHQADFSVGWFQQYKCGAFRIWVWDQAYAKGMGNVFCGRSSDILELKRYSERFVFSKVRHGGYSHYLGCLSYPQSLFGYAGSFYSCFGGDSGGFISANQKVDWHESSHRQDGSEQCENFRVIRDSIFWRLRWDYLGGALIGAVGSFVILWFTR